MNYSNPQSAISCCLLILNYNGKAHLKDCLPSALEAVGASGLKCPVVVLDNRSTEDDVAYIRSEFPGIQVILSKKNDYCFSLNDAVAERSEDIVILLNNDMRFDPGFIGPLLTHFEDPCVFAVTAKVLDWQGRPSPTTGVRIGFFRKGWFYKRWVRDVSRTRFTLDAGVGCAAFHRRMFLELGGLDRLYYPAYCEDTDLSYRAWQRGWKVVYEPSSVIYHKVSATLNQMYDDFSRTRLIRRNEVLFTVKNCGDFLFLITFLCLLLLRALRSYLSGDRSLALGILGAAPRIPLALKKRLKEHRFRQVSDKDFLERIKQDS